MGAFGAYVFFFRTLPRVAPSPSVGETPRETSPRPSCPPRQRRMSSFGPRRAPSRKFFWPGEQVPGTTVPPTRQNEFLARAPSALLPDPLENPMTGKGQETSPSSQSPSSLNPPEDRCRKFPGISHDLGRNLFEKPRTCPEFHEMGGPPRKTLGPKTEDSPRSPPTPPPQFRIARPNNSPLENDWDFFLRSPTPCPRPPELPPPPSWAPPRPPEHRTRNCRHHGPRG